jgi:EmrB/QacA subfamily drug resistance transporter
VSTDPTRPIGPADPRRWWALTLLCGLQFMILMDTTAANVALPRIQRDLGFTESGLAWVVNGYVLVSGGLLLLGGRMADVLGRRRLLLLGVVVFAVSSAASGAATTPATLIAGRFGQGAAEAIAAPASLGIVALLFPEPAERTKALGAWSGLMALGGTVGYVVSGALTELASWRWIFFLNVPVALAVLAFLPRLVTESRMTRTPGGRLDVAGGVGVTAGALALVHGLLRAADHPWTAPSVLVPLVAGTCLLASVPVVERRAANPLLPPGFFADRTRSVANAASLLLAAAFVSYAFVLTLFMQRVLGYSPLQGGLAWLPLGLSIGVGIGVGTALCPRLGTRVVIAVSFFGAAAGLLVVSRLHVGAGYVDGLLPGMVLFGIFAGATMPATTSAALHEVTGQDSGLASGVQSTTQQVGGALGLAVLIPLAVRYAEAELARGTAPDVATTAGYALALRIGAALAVLGGVAVLALLQPVTSTGTAPARAQGR